jgi:hypothetical protein
MCCPYFLDEKIAVVQRYRYNVALLSEIVYGRAGSWQWSIA